MTTPPDAPDTSVIALVKASAGVVVVPTKARFTESGWSFEGTPDVVCDACDGPLDVYRKPYTTTKGSYRYWAVVCIGCREACSLDDFEPEAQKALRQWSEQTSTGAVATTIRPVGPSTSLPAISQGQPVVATAAGGPSTPAPPAQASAPLPPRVSRLAIAAAKAEVEATSGQTRTVDVGVAEPVPDSGARSFRVSGPSIDLSEQPPGETFLARTAGDPNAVQCSVRRASPTETVVEVSIDAQVPEQPRLFLRVDPSVVAKAFAEYLESLGDPGLAQVLTGEIMLQSAPAEPVDGFNSEQAAAVGHLQASRACVVWGPPGTGKTRVIGAAVNRLLRAGHSVCLASNTNVAVDQALLQIADAAGKFSPGQILRVGNPTIPEVTEHPLLTVKKAVEKKFESDLRELVRLQNDLADSRSTLADARAADQLSAIEGHSKAGLEAIVTRRQQLARREQLLVELAGLENHRKLAQERADREGAAYDAARTAAGAIEPFKHLIDDDRTAASLQHQLQELDAQVFSLETRLAGLGRGLKDRRARRECETHLLSIVSKRDVATRTLRAAEARLADAATKGATPASVRRIVETGTAAEGKWRSARTELDSVIRAMRSCQESAAQLERVVDLSEAELAVLRLIDKFGSVDQLLSQRQGFEKQIREIETKVGQLSTSISEIQARLEDAEATLISEASVVGTTLAQLVLHRGLKARTFDHVIVDEASAAQAHTVYAALSKATRGCALVGDFEQNWPITSCDVSKVKPELRAWLEDPPFHFVGIPTAEAALATDGSVVLREQYRFGPLVTELANSVAYGGILVSGRPDVGASHEITFIDTSGLRGEGLVQKGPNGSGRWWAIGGALSAEIARRHDFDGIGIVTPYRHQSQFTRAHLIDSGATAVQVGTVHSFQGREFPVVILDLVEDGAGTSWIALGDRGGEAWPRTGSRLFTVAITRTAGHLYIVGNLGTVRSARTGPLAAIRHLLGRDELSVVDATSLIGGVTWEKPIPSTASHSPSFATAESELLNDDDFYRHFSNDLEACSDRCVIFSPFVSERRVSDLIPHLTAAAARGIRVHCFTKPAGALSHPDQLSRLSSIGVEVRERPGMHEKVILIDDDIAYIGSLNALSNSGRTGEVMLRLVGNETNSRLTTWMRQAVRN